MEGKLMILWGLKRVVMSRFPRGSYAKAAAFYNHRFSNASFELGDFRRPNAYIHIEKKASPLRYQSFALRIRPHVIEALTKIRDTNEVIQGLWCNETSGKDMVRILARLPELRKFFSLLICQEDFDDPCMGASSAACHSFEFGTDPDGKIMRANKLAIPPEKDLFRIRQRLECTLACPKSGCTNQPGLFLHQHCRMEHLFEMDRVVAIEYVESKFLGKIVRNLIEIPAYSMISDLLSHPESLFAYDTHDFAGRSRYIMEKLTSVLLDVVFPKPDVRSLLPQLIL